MKMFVNLPARTVRIVCVCVCTNRRREDAKIVAIYFWLGQLLLEIMYKSSKLKRVITY
jgi:hypothetical protein